MDEIDQAKLAQFADAVEAMVVSGGVTEHGLDRACVEVYGGFAPP